MIYLIQGPTASGKTRLAIQLAQFLNTEIISTDSRQFYKEMNIGTAKPTAEELSLVPHHFINNRTVNEPMNVSDFVNEAKPVLAHLYHSKGTVVITGGSSQFTDALIYGIDEVPIYPEIQDYWSRIYALNGIDDLQKELKMLDQRAFEQLDIQNPRRVIRAIEVMSGSGKSILDYQQKNKSALFPICRFYVQWNRNDLYLRINERVDQMIEMGLELEVDSLSKSCATSMLNTVGYKEWDLRNQGVSASHIVEKIKQNTRNYAKRQITWLNQYEHIHALNPYLNIPVFNQALEFISKQEISE
jgi:tRNA dimethylallyltransferase